MVDKAVVEIHLVMEVLEVQVEEAEVIQDQEMVDLEILQVHLHLKEMMVEEVEIIQQLLVVVVEVVPVKLEAQLLHLLHVVKEEMD